MAPSLTIKRQLSYKLSN